MNSPFTASPSLVDNRRRVSLPEDSLGGSPQGGPIGEALDVIVPLGSPCGKQDNRIVARLGFKFN